MLAIYRYIELVKKNVSSLITLKKKKKTWTWTWTWTVNNNAYIVKLEHVCVSKKYEN